MILRFSKLLLCGCSLAFALAFGADFQAPTPAELSQKESLVEKGADAEILLYQETFSNDVKNGVPITTRSVYLRIKVFNFRGRDQWSTKTLNMGPKMQILGLVGRTIHPDGTIVDLDPSSIFERVSNKTGANGQKIKQKSFTLPAVEPDSLIEYRWTEETEARFSENRRFDFQTSIPIREVRFLIRPYRAPNFNYQMLVQAFNCQYQKDRDINDFVKFTLVNIPALHPEPLMPPDNEVRAWLLVFYRANADVTAEQFWKDYGRKLYEHYKPRMKVSGMVRQKAGEIVAKASTDEEKLLLIEDFCRHEIKNSQTEAVTAEERADVQANKTPEDTLKQGVGTGEEIRELFGALATAAGFEARIAALPNRDQVFFNRQFAEPYFLNERDVAVLLGDKWRFYDPVTVGLPRDMLAWRHEAVEALISDPKDPQFALTPMASAEQNLTHREGSFRLSEDGTLEGNIDVRYHGHVGALWKENFQHRSDADREESIKNTLKSIASTAEFSEIKIENVTDPDKPFTYHCHVRIPAYAQRTGKRLFFVPSLFQQGSNPMFALKERKFPVYFRYPSMTEDKIAFEMPAGFQPETPRIPAPITMQPVGRYEVKAHIDNKTLFVYERRFVLGEHRLIIPPDVYSNLKAAMDSVALSDQQTITLKLAEEGSK